MKAILLAITAIFTFNTSIMAQKGFDVQREITINVPADQLWEMVGPGFVDVYKWASSVDHAEGSGTPEFDGAACSERVCNVNVKGFSKISEKLTKYDATNMNLAYEVQDGMPGFVTRAANDWTVVPVNDHQSKLVMKAQFRSKGLMGSMMNGMMKKKMYATLEQVLGEAKLYAETGQLSDEKQKRMAQLAKKQKRAAA